MNNLKSFIKDEEKRKIIFLIISGISLIMSFFELRLLPFDEAYIAVVLCGIPIIKEGAEGLITRFDIKADVLVSLALIASVVIGEIFAAGEVAFIMTIGALLEEHTVEKARRGIEKLVHLTPTTARVVNGNEENIVNAVDVKINDIIRVLPGETIPVDGVISEGETSIDQSVMTGESMPVDKTIGDEVYSGTINQFGAFNMKASKIGEDSSLQKMIKLVKSADAEKAEIVGIADRWATWIVVIALLSSVGTWLVTGEIIRAVTILVVFCPCSLVLATPTAIMAGIGNATERGILIKEGDALERLAKIKKITFDKTGTLTYGRPKVTKIHTFNDKLSEEEILNLAASIERYSEHPIGKAILDYYNNVSEYELKDISDFKLIIGRGVSGRIEDDLILAGNIKLLNEYNIYLSEEQKKLSYEFIEEGCTVIFLAVNNIIEGFIVVQDVLRDNVSNVIQKIKSINIDSVLITGDNKHTAQNVGKLAGIDNIYSECLPEDKLSIIEKFQDNQVQVAMIGDGINDTPALKKAFVGIAMGGIGSDIAIECADIALVGDDIKSIPHLLELSKKTMKTININLILSMLLNFIAIVLAMTGILNPVVGALVHNIGSVVVIIHSALLLKWEKTNKSIE